MKFRIFDTGNDTYLDRYTVVFNDKYLTYLGMSAQPFHPLGFCQHGELGHQGFKFNSDLSHLGNEITIDNLPAACKLAIERDLE